MIRMTLETGDSKYNGRTRTARLTVDADSVAISLDEDCATIPRGEFVTLAIQVGGRDLKGWQSACIIGGPMARLRNVVRAIDSTASYQLFMAAVEIGSLLHIGCRDAHLEILSPMEGCFAHLGENGLYFLDYGTAKELAKSLDALVAVNKLCRLTLESGNVPTVMYYVPYATPCDTPKPLRSAWETIRGQYMEARGD